jgi:hypothetical protein
LENDGELLVRGRCRELSCVPEQLNQRDLGIFL